MMATTTARRRWEDAKRDAEAFKSLFDNPACYERWMIAGSIRRRKPEVADVEHVVIPKVGDVPGDGLFLQEVSANLLWHRVEELWRKGIVSQHLYTSHKQDGTTSVSPRWGDKYRGVNFRGFNHEIFTATAENWGSILAIRTGPADYSRMLVIVMQRHGYRQQEGTLHGPSGPVAVPDEETFFRCCGLPWLAPERRA